MSDSILVATRKGLFTLKRDGGRWAIADRTLMGNPVSAVLRDPRDGTLYAALYHGHFGCKLHRSKDGGKTFPECPVPEYPPLAEGEKPAHDEMRGIDIPNKLHMIWTLEPGGADQPGTIWCGTLPGGLFRSDDGGDTWGINRGLWDRPQRKKWFGGGYDYAGIHSICVDPRDAQRVALAVSSGGVWASENGGQTWEPRTKGMRAEYVPPELSEAPESQDPHRMAACRAIPDAWWIQHHNGIFKSDNAGRQWREIDKAGPSTFGFAVAVHPHDENTAWFVPATKDEMRIPADGKVVVTRTRDGGQSFETLTTGLPQQHAYHLVYRHALEVDDTGQRLVMGSTTGSVWTSEDQGDSWQRLSSDLPPVYAVRFG